MEAKGYQGNILLGISYIITGDFIVCASKMEKYPGITLDQEHVYNWPFTFKKNGFNKIFLQMKTK